MLHPIPYDAWKENTMKHPRKTTTVLGLVCAVLAAGLFWQYGRLSRLKEEMAELNVQAQRYQTVAQTLEHELNNQVRLINVMDYPIDNCDEFLGFVCGIVSQDHDLEEMYLDSFLTIASLEEEGAITRAIEKLDIISEKFKVKFILSVSKNIEQLPECAKAKVIISL